MSKPGVQAVRGRPIVFFLLLLGTWISARTALWETPWPVLPHPDRIPLFAQGDLQARDAGPARSGERRAARQGARPAQLASVAASLNQPILMPSAQGAEHEPPSMALFATHRRAVNQNLLWMAGMSALPMPTAVSSLLDAASPAADLSLRADGKATAAHVSRWRVDGWLVLRQGAGVPNSLGSRPPVYGGNQFGAVLGYRLAPGSKRDPVAYVRASKALVDNGETEGAAGIRIRPIGRLPINAHAEMRLSYRSGRADWRPAAFASAGIDDVPLPLDLRLEGYAQAGYVGGAFATAFGDGRVTARREFAVDGGATASAGLGIWGGAQKGAARLDTGPSVQLDLDLGPTPVRIAADYRVRLAGNAEPHDGVAITLSTGF